jgi:hypothetical protein
MRPGAATRAAKAIAALAALMYGCGSAGAADPLDASPWVAADSGVVDSAQPAADANLGHDVGGTSDAVQANDTVLPGDTTGLVDAIAPGDGSGGADAGAEVDAANVDASDADSSAPAKGPTTGICFAALPSAATSTGAVPMPATALSCPGLDAPDWFAEAPVPAPVLQLDIGYRDAANQWQPYLDGDWVPLGTLQQGGFHLDLVPQVLLPGLTAVKQQVQAEAFAHSACQVTANLALSKAWLVQAPGPEFVYTTDPNAKTLLVFGDSASQIGKSCGIWLQVVWRVRLAGTDSWGQVVRTLRTYDASGLAQGISPNP